MELTAPKQLAIILRLKFVSWRGPGGGDAENADNEKTEREIKEIIPFTIATKIIQYLGIYLPKETKELFISSVQFSHSVMSDSLRPHESQHARPPCPSPTPIVHSDSRPSSQ